MMEIKKELPEISWQTTESEYRADPALSYSTLAKFSREGFEKLDTLFDHISTPSLVLGSMVDTLITGSAEEFDELFYVVNMPSIEDKEKLIADDLFTDYGNKYADFRDIPYEVTLDKALQYEYHKNWREDTRVKVLCERCAEYYGHKQGAKGKQIVTTDMYDDAKNMVFALKTSPATKWYFADDDESSPVRRYYQLKFKMSHDGVDYRSMADLIVVNYAEKEVIPCDLKTSGHPEYLFEDSFKKWSYMIQARLYWRQIRNAMDGDDYFKDFELKDYRFIVVNSKTLNPLVWEFPYTKAKGTLVDESGKEYEDPFDIGRRLDHYLKDRPKVPDNINGTGLNTITCLNVRQKFIA